MSHAARGLHRAEQGPPQGDATAVQAEGAAAMPAPSATTGSDPRWDPSSALRRAPRAAWGSTLGRMPAEADMLEPSIREMVRRPRTGRR